MLAGGGGGGGGGQPTYGKFHMFRRFFFESFPKIH